MHVFIANDHGGYRLKKLFVQKLRQDGHTVTDCGCDSEKIVRYPYYAAQVASAVSEGWADRGILICSTGIGMSVAANKFPGVRAALVCDSYTARRTREHNDSNILCIGGQSTGDALALDILDVWMHTVFLGGRHVISLDLIQELERQNLTGDCWNPGDRERWHPET